MKTRIVFALGVVVITVLNVGCAGLRVRPDSASIAVPKVQTPISASVGIVRADQKLSGGFPDIVPAFKRYLEESSLFQRVYYPTRPNDQFDGGIVLHLNAGFKADGTLFPKAFFTGFFLFLPAPVFWYNHKYQADCTLDVMRGDQKLKSYTVKSEVMASHQLFGAPDVLQAEGTDAAAKLLSARLIEQLQNDREFLQNELRTRKAASVP